MVKSKLDFRREEIKVGVLYGMFFPKRVVNIVKSGTRSVIVKLVDYDSKHANEMYGLLVEGSTGWYEMEKISTLSEIKNLYKVQEKIKIAE